MPFENLPVISHVITGGACAVLALLAAEWTRHIRERRDAVSGAAISSLELRVSVLETSVMTLEAKARAEALLRDIPARECPVREK